MNKNYMMRMRPNIVTGVSSPVKAGAGAGQEPAGAWEVRPCGMLVQKRNSDCHQNANPVPNIRVKVKFGSCYHEITISSQASFGDLKKMLAGVTGLNPQDQKLMYKDKERNPKHFLDNAGVKDGSKLVLIEDELSKERKCIESRKNAKMEQASKEIAAIRVDVDKLAKQVASAELDIHGGKQVVDKVLLNLIELLMTQLIKLDGIDADGDVKLQRRMQVKRVQKYIETLDVLKMKNSALGKAPVMRQKQQYKLFTGQMPVNYQNHQQQQQQRSFTERVNSGPTVVTTKWETF